MTKITIDREKCKGCLLCVNFCPKGLISADENLNHRGIRPVIFKKGSDCLGCAMCAVICPDCCISLLATQDSARA